MIALVLALMAAAPQALPPKVVSPVVVPPLPKESPPVDVTVNMAADVDSPGSQAVSIWPARTYQQRRAGAVTLTCWINVEGLADWCRVAFERPTGRGFGDAAMATRPHIKVAPRKGPDGAPVAGLMNIGMTFNPPDTQMQEQPGAGATRLSLQRGAIGIDRNPLPNTRITLVNNPVWTQAPSFEAVERAYPQAGGGAIGFAVAHCRARDDGRLSSCRVATEDPDKQGFGAAALKLANDFRLEPEIIARAPRGEPVEVEVPIRFTPPGAARTVEAPFWLQGLDPQATPKVFPPEAVAKWMTTGHGVARCVVGVGGALTGCTPDGDDPEGFSAAAARLAGVMRMNLWSADARPVEGGTVYVAMRLNLKGGS